MIFKQLELNDIVARPDLAAATGSVLHVVIPIGVNPRLVPIKHIRKIFGDDYSYLAAEAYPIAAGNNSGIYQPQPSISVVGRLNDDFTITLNELPQ